MSPRSARGVVEVMSADYAARHRVHRGGSRLLWTARRGGPPLWTGAGEVEVCRVVAAAPRAGSGGRTVGGLRRRGGRGARRPGPARRALRLARGAARRLAGGAARRAGRGRHGGGGAAAGVGAVEAATLEDDPDSVEHLAEPALALGADGQ